MSMAVDGVPYVELDTTGTTVASLATCLTSSNQVYTIKSTVFGIRHSDGAAYTSVKEATYQADAVGNLSLIGTINTVLTSIDGLLGALGLGGPTHNLEIIGNGVVQRVKGTAGASFHWGGILEYKTMQYPD